MATTPTPSRTSLADAKRAWRAAVRRLAEAGTGRYTWTARVDGFVPPMADEAGGYGLDPMRTSFERHYRLPSRSGTSDTTLRIRRGSDYGYFQKDEWAGAWRGCWISLIDESLSQATGVDFASAPDLPVTIVALLDARVVGVNAPAPPSGTALAGDVNAALGLQFLNLSSRTVVALREQIEDLRVPVAVRIDADGSAQGLSVEGRDVLAALARQHVKVDAAVSEFLSLTHATSDITSSGGSFEVEVPAEDTVLPSDADEETGCSRNG